MLREKSVGDQVYKNLYPHSNVNKSNEPNSWQSHVKNNLVTEIRTEVLMYYGDIDSLEAKFPGLDYSYAPHRRRLSRFHHHSKLFEILDELCLTENEIFELCNWEGTLYMKRKYEQEHGVTIEDTTLDCIPKPEPLRTVEAPQAEVSDGLDDASVPKDELGFEESTESVPANAIQGEPHSTVVSTSRVAGVRPRGDPAALLSEEQWATLVKAFRESHPSSTETVDDAALRNFLTSNPSHTRHFIQTLLRSPAPVRS